MSDRAARDAAREQWGVTPAGTSLVSAEWGTPEFFAQMTTSRYTAQPWHRALLAEFHPTGRLLEIGCGAGTDHFELARMATETHAIDLAQEGVDLTNQRLRLAGLPANARVADAEALPYPDGYFDEVYSFGVIHHTDHPDRVVAEMARVLRPGGRFLVALYHRYSLFAAQKLAEYALRGRGQSWRDFLALVESGAESMERRPLVRLFTRRSARRLFTDTDLLTGVQISTVHPYLRGRILRGPGTELVGWYLIVKGLRR